MRQKAIAVTILALAVLVTPAYGQWAMKAEPNHSTVGFSVSIMGGITKVTGKFTKYSTDIVFDEEDMSRSSVAAVIQASSIDTGIDSRDKDLSGPAFFHTAEHPEIIFQSKRIEKRGERYVATGDLTMRGVTREIELPFVITGINRNDEGRPLIGVAASLTLDRQDFGVGSDWKHSAIPNFIGDEVSIEIFLWTRRGKKVEE